MELPYKIYDTLTAGELRNKLKGVSNDSHVYVVLDKSEDNYDDDGHYRVVHPVDCVQRELHEVVRIEKNHFIDTGIETALLIIRKSPTDKVRFADNETGSERFVPIEEIKAASYNLAVSHYIAPDVPKQLEVNPWELEQTARKGALRRIKAEIEFSMAIANLENWDVSEFIEEIIAMANSYRKQPSLFP